MKQWFYEPYWSCVLNTRFRSVGFNTQSKPSLHCEIMQLINNKKTMKEIKFKTLKDIARKFNKRTIVGKIRDIKKVLLLSAALTTATTLGGVIGHYGHDYIKGMQAVKAKEGEFQKDPISTPSKPFATIISDYVKTQSHNDNIFAQAEFFSGVERGMGDKPISKPGESSSKSELLSQLTAVNPHTKIVEAIHAINNEVNNNNHATDIYNLFSSKPIGFVAKSDTYFASRPDALRSVHGKELLKETVGSYDDEAIKGGLLSVADKIVAKTYGTRQMFDDNKNLKLFVILHEMAHLSDHTFAHDKAFNMDFAPGSAHPQAAKTMPIGEYARIKRKQKIAGEAEADTMSLLAMIKILTLSKSEAIQITKDVLLWRANNSRHHDNNIHLGLTDRVVLIDLINNHFSDIKNMDMGSIPALSHFIHEFSLNHPMPHRIRAVLADEFGETEQLSVGSTSYANDYLRAEYRDNPDALVLPVDSIPAHHSISEALNQSVFGQSREHIEPTLDANAILYGSPPAQP